MWWLSLVPTGTMSVTTMVELTTSDNMQSGLLHCGRVHRHLEYNDTRQTLKRKVIKNSLIGSRLDYVI